MMAMSRTQKNGYALVMALFWLLLQDIAEISGDLVAQDSIGQGFSTVQNAAQNKPLREIWSSNRKYFAQTYSEGATVVNQVSWQGNIGRFERFWSAKTGGEAAALSNTGEHLAVVYTSGGILPMDYDSKQILLRFFNKEKPVAEIELVAIVSDLSKLRKEDSGYYWGKCLGLNAAGYYVLETVEGKTILIDLKSGVSEEFRSGQGSAAPGCKVFEDVMQWFEFQYSEEFSLKTYMRDDRIPTEAIFFKNGRRDWVLRAIVEMMPDFSATLNSANSSFDDFALDQFKAMNCADGPESSRYIDGIAEKQAFVNSHGLQVLEFYLTLVDENTEGDERRIERRTIGPAYAVLIAHPGEARRVLFFQMNPDAKEIQAAAGELSKMVHTVKVLR